MSDRADLVNRLRGIYNIPVNDGLGPLNGSMVYTRKFSGNPPVQLEAADRIEALERGEVIFEDCTGSLIKRLLTPGYYMNMPEPYVPPIHKEAARKLEELLKYGPTQTD